MPGGRRGSGATLDVSVDAYHELRTFPEGLAYILDQWSIILESLSESTPLLGSTRQRCFSLICKTSEHVLRSDQTATTWFLNLAALMYGQKATLEDILALLGTDAPEWMDDAEFVTSRSTIAERGAGGGRGPGGPQGSGLRDHGGSETELTKAREVAARDLELDTAVACADATPEGTKLTNAIDKVDRSCLAAIRRLEARQRAAAAGSGTGPGAIGDRRRGPRRPGRTRPGRVQPTLRPMSRIPSRPRCPPTRNRRRSPPRRPRPTSRKSWARRIRRLRPTAEPAKCEVEANSGPDPASAEPAKCEYEANSGPDRRRPSR